ncbi:hypothetical protein GEMRC1_006974 [Eukaryota sp. GEM-RC1]
MPCTSKIQTYQQAAQRGDVTAMVSLAHCFLEGNEVEQNVRQAVYWFMKACSCPNARNNLEKTIQWCKENAELGDALAMAALGVCYEHGIGVVQDQSLAVYWYQKAADSGDSYAMFSLGLCHFFAKGVPEDPAQAVSWFQKRC